MLYYYVHNAAFFHDAFVPALASSWRQRSFDPCRPLWASLLPAIESFAAKGWAIAQEPLIVLAAKGLSFDRHYWNQLVGEVMLYGAVEIPELEGDISAIREMIAPGAPADRSNRNHLLEIEQAHYGSRDLTFGLKVYRPEHVGYNDVVDVPRLSSYLDRIDSVCWQPESIPEEDCDEAEVEESLAFARQSLVEIQALYRHVAAAGQLILHELL